METRRIIDNYKICNCTRCYKYCFRNTLFQKNNDGLVYMPLKNYSHFSDILNILSRLGCEFIDDDGNINKFVNHNKKTVLENIKRYICLEKEHVFCYSSISSRILNVLEKNMFCSNKKSIIDDYRRYNYIENILHLFFGDPDNKNNILRRAWLTNVKVYLNQKFLESKVDDRIRRCIKIHNKTKKFKIEYVGKCELCGKDISETLWLSHIKPWERCSHPIEKRDINNTLLLCYDHDRMLSNGYISFDDSGRLLLSEELSGYQIRRYELDKYDHIDIEVETLPYLQYHRKHIFRRNSN